MEINYFEHIKLNVESGKLMWFYNNLQDTMNWNGNVFHLCEWGAKHSKIYDICISSSWWHVKVSHKPIVVKK